MSLLILGGTADGRNLATELHRQGLPVTYSVAGLVRLPDVECRVISGGFRPHGGLAQYVQRHCVKAILDATHPYAKKMSDAAVMVAETLAIPCWRFHRPAWQPSEGDTWHSVHSWGQLHHSLASFASIFLTCGQLSQSEADAFKHNPGQVQLLRTAAQPKIQLLQSMSWIKAIGPFVVGHELALMRAHKIDALVSKNSGGSSTSAKLDAARELGIPVWMFERPKLRKAHRVFSSVALCSDFVRNRFFTL